MPQIIIEHNPSEERLKELGVADWANGFQSIQAVSASYMARTA